MSQVSWKSERTGSRPPRATRSRIHAAGCVKRLARSLRTSLLGVLAAVVLVPFVLAVALILASRMGRAALEERQRFWSDALTEVRPGSSRKRVEQALLAHGVALDCGVDRDGIAECVGRDPRTFGVLPEWHVRFLVRFEGGALQSIERATVGVGL